MQGLARIASADIRRLFDQDGTLLPPSALDESTAATIASFEVQSRGDGGTRPTSTVTRVRLADRLRALELLAKYFGLLKDRVELDIDTAKLVALPPDRLAEIRQLAVAARETVETLRRI